MVRVGRTLDLRLGVFGQASLEEVANDAGVGIETTIEKAAAAYAALASERREPNGDPASRLPEFAKTTAGDAPATRVHVVLYDEWWEALEGEAGRYGVSLERVLEYAAMRCLAENEVKRQEDYDRFPSESRRSRSA